MKILIMVSSFILVFASLAVAGNVYGTISENGKAVGAAKIEITCGADKYNAETDPNGGFKVFVKDQGKCDLKLAYQGQTPSFEINSFEGSVQYDLVLEKKGTQYTLKRK